MDASELIMPDTALLQPEQPQPTSQPTSSSPQTTTLTVSQRPIALQSSQFRKIPAEVMLRIAWFLPIDSALCFALCCVPMYSLLGLDTLEAFLTRRTKRYKFLNTLALDLPRYIVCYECKKLHTMDRPERHLDSHPPKHTFNLVCAAKEYALGVHEFFPHFSYVIFQMTMKLYRQGLDYSEHLGHLSYGPIMKHFGNGIIHADMALARITKDGSLLLRTQRIVPGEKPQAACMPLLKICPHIDTLQPNELDPDGDDILWSYHPDREKPVHGYEIIRCHYCLTEYYVHKDSSDKHPGSVIVTKWQELGKARSRLDGRWLDHLHRYGYPLLPTDVLQPVDYEYGSLCTRFEEIEHDSSEDDRLLSREGWGQLLNTGAIETAEVGEASEQ